MKRVCIVILALSSPAALAMAPDRVDLSVGLSTGASSYDHAPLAPAEGSVSAGALVLTPFAAVPYTGVHQSGFEGEIGVAIEHVRISLAHRRPVSWFAMEDTVVALDDGQIAITRGLSAEEWQLGFGYELPIESAPVVPYVELAGVHQAITADLALTEGMVRYQGRGFGFLGKGGILFRFAEQGFVDVYGQKSFYGPDMWAAGLSLGLSL